MLILIGLLLTGVLLYYRAVNFQRFLEPSLAVLAPSTTFTSRFKQIASEELSSAPKGMVRFTGSGILVHKALFSMGETHGVPPVIPSLARILNRLFSDPWMAANIQLVMVKTEVDLESALNDPSLRTKMREQAEAVLNAILAVDPKLIRGHSESFAATAVYKNNVTSSDWITLELVPSERLHIEMLERLGKYAHQPPPTN